MTATSQPHTAWYYRLLGCLLKGMAHLQFWMLYGLSDLMFVITYYVVRYRRKTVAKNIADSFPEKSGRERQDIIRRFYRHFTDYFVETVKLHHISDQEMKRRMEFVDSHVIDDLMNQGRSIIVYFSHCGNWEWAPSISLWTRHQPEVDAVFAQVYRPLTNPWFDQYFLDLRSRFHSRSFTKSAVLRDLVRLRRDPRPSITGFMSDQKPSHNDDHHVVMFLNHPTAIITGTEMVARKLDMAVIYWDMDKPRRGHYRITTRLITEHPADMPPMSITDTYARMLEQSIRRTPHIWLWSHKRWKHPVTLPSENETGSSHHS